jgi:hypothetical protein
VGGSLKILENQIGEKLYFPPEKHGVYYLRK